MIESSPNFTKFETSSVGQRKFYDRLFYGLCVIVSTLSIVVLGILLTTIILSALPVVGPHSDSFVSQNNLAIVQVGDDGQQSELIGAGDLIQGVFKSETLVRGGLGNSNDQQLESGSLIGVYSFQIENTIDDGDNLGLSHLRPATGKNNISNLLKAAWLRNTP